MNNHYDDDDIAEAGATVPTQAQSRAVASLQDLKRGLTNAKATAPTRTLKPLLRMLKGNGHWVYGREETAIEVDSDWAVNPYVLHGYVCWAAPSAAGKRKLGEVMVPVTQPKPDMSALPDLGGEWSDQLGFDAKCVAGADEGLEVSYRSNSQGGIEVVVALIDAISAQLDAGSDRIVPIARLRSSSYQHASYGKIYKPLLEIVGWVGIDEEPTGAVPPPAKPAGSAGSEVIRRRRVAA